MALPRVEVTFHEPEPYATLRFYATDENDYDASLQLVFRGEGGYIHTLNGSEFFKHSAHYYKAIFVNGVKYIDFEMMPHVFRALKYTSRDYYDLEELGPVVCEGRDMLKVRIRLKTP